MKRINALIEMDLHTAVEKGEMEIVEALLSHNPEIDARDKNGNTPLILACKHAHVEIVELLLKHNPDVNALNARHHTPLIAALNSDCNESKRLAICEMLKRHHADVNIPDSYGLTNLVVSIRRKKNNIFEWLLNNGASLETECMYCTVLDFAVNENSLNDAEELLKRGANVNKDILGETALSRAVKLDLVGMAGLLIAYGAEKSYCGSKQNLINCAQSVQMRKLLE